MRGWSMGLFGGAIEGDEVHVPHPVSETWPALRSAISAHRGITGASFNDSLRRVQFKTWATLGHTLSAVVSPETDGSRVLVSTVVKWQSTGRQERGADPQDRRGDPGGPRPSPPRHLSLDGVGEHGLASRHLGVRGCGGDGPLRAATRSRVHLLRGV